MQSYNAGKTGQLSTPEKVFRKKNKTKNNTHWILVKKKKLKKKSLKEVLKALPKEVCSLGIHTSDFWPDT